MVIKTILTFFSITLSLTTRTAQTIETVCPVIVISLPGAAPQLVAAQGVPAIGTRAHVERALVTKAGATPGVVDSPVTDMKSPPITEMIIEVAMLWAVSASTTVIATERERARHSIAWVWGCHVTAKALRADATNPDLWAKWVMTHDEKLWKAFREAARRATKDHRLLEKAEKKAIETKRIKAGMRYSRTGVLENEPHRTWNKRVSMMGGDRARWVKRQRDLEGG